MSSVISRPDNDLTISVATLLAMGFVLQLCVPLVVFGSTSIGALIWLFCSAILFLLPSLAIPFRTTPLPQLQVLAAIFLPPIIFIGISNAVNGKSDGRDIADIFRAVYFAIAFIAGVRVAAVPQRIEDWLLRMARLTLPLLWLYLISSFVLRNEVDNLELLFGKADNAVSARLFAPFPNPYDLALFCLLPIIYCVLTRRRYLTIGFLVVLLASQSRTGLVLLVLAISVLIVWSTRTRGPMVRFSLLIAGGILAVFAVFLDFEDIRSIYLISNSIGLVEGQSTTLARRFVQWEYLSDLPLLGWGTVTSANLVIENGLIYELYRTGITGVYTILSFYALPGLLALRTLKTQLRRPAALALAMFVLLTVIGSASSVFIYQPKLSLLYWFSCGALYSFTIEERTQERMCHETGPLLGRG
jgi:hypothetical protein